MTSGPFREVDHDLLADYVGGALDGRPEAQRVAQLIATDADWAEAHATLVSALDAVRVDLSDWGAVAVTMPDDVAARLSAVLATAPDLPAPTEKPPAIPAQAASGEASPGATDRPAGSTPRPAPTERPSGTGPEPTRPRLTVVDGGGDDRRTRPGVRRRRWSRLAGPVSVAAAVAAFAGFGVSRLVDQGSAGDAAGSAAISAEPGAVQGAPVPGTAVPDPEPRASIQAGTAAPGFDRTAQPRSDGREAAVLEPSTERLLTSGVDYTPETLAATVSTLRQQAAEGPGGKQGASPMSVPRVEGSLPPVPGLVRLADRDALSRCLDAVAVAHDQGSVAVDLVDYASFQGRPALVLAFTDSTGARWSWVVGSNCGMSGAGADDRYRLRVG